MADRSDKRSAAAQAYRKWYKLPAWQRAREAQLAGQPLCERCDAKGRVTPATIVNHRTPHRGDWSLFIDPDNHESACKRCHDRVIQSEERLGYSSQIGDDGWPVDPNHPSNKLNANQS